jgi:hypothetical protein
MARQHRVVVGVIVLLIAGVVFALGGTLFDQGATAAVAAPNRSLLE